MIRLDKYLSTSGLGSRELVKEMIRAGRVTVPGAAKVLPETKVEEGCTVYVDGQPFSAQKFQYVMMNKPAGYLTAKSDRSDPVVMELFEKAENKAALRDVPLKSDVSPVGRLDKDAEGLLLFTNDGATAHRLLSPKNEIPKTYYVRTAVPIPEGSAKILRKPVVFTDFTSKPAELQILSENEALITVVEGKFHEVKRLMHHVGADVTVLVRKSFGPISLGDLSRGEVRFLTDEEIDSLRNL